MRMSDSDPTARLSDTEILPSPVAEPQTPVYPSSCVRVDLAGRSDRGKTRPRNEDHFLIGRVSREIRIDATNLPTAMIPSPEQDNGYVMVVADGMGGMGGGAEASQLALITGFRLVRQAEKWILSADPTEAHDLLQRFRAYFEQVDREIMNQSRSNGLLAGMGTTLTVAYSVGNGLYIVHAGDSRAYLHHAESAELIQITRDHTVAQAMADAGQIPVNQVKTHQRRHVLTNCLGGTSAGVQADFHGLRLRDGDRLLLCSDGLSDLVDDSTIAECLGQAETAEHAANALITTALEAGGRDNVTAVVAFYQIDPPDSPTLADPETTTWTVFPATSGPGESS